MSLIVGTKVKGEGLTTAFQALSLVWRRSLGGQVVLAELNWLGGDLAVRYGLVPNLVTLAAAGPGEIRADRFAGYFQRLGDLALLLAPPSAEQMQAALERRWIVIADQLRAIPDTDVLVDAGLLIPGAPSAEVIARADLGVVVARPTPDSMIHLLRRIPKIPLPRQGLVVLMVGEGPIKDREVEDTTGLTVVGHLPWDRDGAELLMSGHWTDRALRRSSLLRWSVNISETLQSLAASPVAGTAPADVASAAKISQRWPPGPAERPQAVEASADQVEVS
jgi:MinD-like ATPase involved in chromosome partitioning or flagellar assembly